jgi:type IV pilus assembly protein PilF
MAGQNHPGSIQAPAAMMRRPLAAALLAFALAAPACSHAPSRKERETAEIHYNLGIEALRARRWQDALRELDQSLGISDAFPEAHLARGIVYEFGYGKYGEAARDYRRAIELKPDYSEAHNDLGQLHARQGRYEDAIREFDAALENMYYGEPYVARCNRGQALHALGKKEEGRQEMRACLSLAPRYCAGYRGLGRLELDDGRVKEALELLGKYAELCGTVPDAWLQLGLARMRAGDADEARQAFRKCADLAGADPAGEECARAAERLQ